MPWVPAVLGTEVGCCSGTSAQWNWSWCGLRSAYAFSSSEGGRPQNGRLPFFAQSGNTATSLRLRLCTLPPSFFCSSSLTRCCVAGWYCCRTRSAMAPTMRCPGKSGAAAGAGTALAAQAARHAARILPRMSALLSGRQLSACPVVERIGSEKSVGRPRQAEIFAQCFALIFAPEQTAPLQFRHHALDEIIEPAGQVGKHDGETVGAFGGEPFLHLIVDGPGRADYGETAIPAKPPRAPPPGH